MENEPDARAFILDDEEQKIEDAIDSYTPVKGEERARIEAILDGSRKKKTISLRLTDSDLDQLKSRAQEEGIPYQTLITSILRKYLSDQLVDRREMKKTFSMAREAGIRFG